jgi:dihydroorotate dehydrogenase
MLYRLIFNLFFKRTEPELAHKLGVMAFTLAFKFGITRPARNPKMIEIMGLKFENRLGIAAGFDKNAKYVKPLHALGFGHVEIGTVTAHGQPGNPRPRMFRVPEFRALINRMGFNNDGAELVAKRLQRLRGEGGRLPVIGVNIGKSKITEPENAADDYRQSAKLLAPFADYLAVNVSSPNTPGLRDLQQVNALRPILSSVVAESLGKPVLVKVAPDLDNQDLIEIIDLVAELGLAGIIAANTTIKRENVGSSAVLNEPGGLSGPVLAARATQMLKLIRERLGESFVVISVGGLETGKQARERIELGADLVQAYTGFVYGGPLWPKRITRSL